jgi:hypothetical protein
MSYFDQPDKPTGFPPDHKYYDPAGDSSKITQTVNTPTIKQTAFNDPNDPSPRGLPAQHPFMRMIKARDAASSRNYSDPTPEMLSDPLWNAIYNEIQAWDINVPSEYGGYCGATGNHATAIFLAIKKAGL